MAGLIIHGLISSSAALLFICKPALALTTPSSTAVDMADAIVSAVLQQLVTIISETAKQEVELVTGVDREIKKLTSNFQAIQAVLQDAERKQVKEVSVRHWLNELKEVSYDLEDVLDEWKTCLLRLKIRPTTEAP